MKLIEAKLRELICEVLNESRFNKKASSGVLGMKRGDDVSKSYYKKLEKEKNEKIVRYRRKLELTCSGGKKTACEELKNVDAYLASLEDKGAMPVPTPKSIRNIEASTFSAKRIRAYMEKVMENHPDPEWREGFKFSFRLRFSAQLSEPPSDGQLPFSGVRQPPHWLFDPGLVRPKKFRHLEESDFRPELDAEGEREERERLAMDQRGRRMRAYARIPMSDKWDDWENRHSFYIAKDKERGEFGKHSTLDYYLWSRIPMEELTLHHFGDYWELDPGDTQGHEEYYVVKRLISPTGDERAYQDAMGDAGLTESVLKQLIYETLEDERGIDGLIKSGEWENINTALSLTVDVGLPLEELPWDLLPMSIMAEDDLVELARYLLDLKGWEEPGHSDPVGRMLRHGIKGMVGKFPRIGRQYAVMAIKKILGLSLRP